MLIKNTTKGQRSKEPGANSPPVIAYLISQYPAPSHTFIRREVAALRSAGVVIRTYSIRPGDESNDPVEARSTFTVLRQPIKKFIVAHIVAFFTRPLRYVLTIRLALRHRVPGVKALIWAFLHFAEAIVLARQLKIDGVTRLHNHFANSAATVGLLTSHFEQMPWSITLHGISEFEYPAGQLLAGKLDHADFAACVSYFGMAQAMRLTRPTIWPRLTLVRCGIDPSDLPSPIAGSNKADPVKVELICVARLSSEKGHAGLIAAVADMLRTQPGLRLTLVGDGPERASLEKLVRNEELEDRVIFLGALDEKATLDRIAGSDVLVLTSFMEGLPIVLIEALALRVPVVASRVAGIPELVEHNVTGLLFDPGNWSGLRIELERIIANPELRRGTAEAGCAEAMSRFTYPDAAHPLIAHFKK